MDLIVEADPLLHQYHSQSLPDAVCIDVARDNIRWAVGRTHLGKSGWILPAVSTVVSIRIASRWTGSHPGLARHRKARP